MHDKDAISVDQQKHINILLVDGDVLTASSVAQVLGREGYNVVTAQSGDEAVHIVDESGVHMILMDIDLGKDGMDGAETASAILQDHHIPIIFLSSHTEKEVVAKIEGIASYGYVAKGSGDAALLTSVKMAFRLFEAHRELRERDRKLDAVTREWQKTFDSTKDIVWILDKDWKITRCNAPTFSLFGMESKDVVGRHCWEIVHGTDKPIEHCPVLPMKRSLCREGMELDMGDCWFNVTADPIMDEAGELAGIVHTLRDVTAAKKSEEIMRLRLELMDYAACHSTEELLVKVLDEVGALTKSPVGFFHFFDQDRKTFLLQAWSTGTEGDFCAREGKKGLHHSMDDAGVWADCVRKGRPVIHNDYASLTHRRGMPPGHVPIVRELVVPISRGGRIVAVLGLGNKQEDYTEKDVSITAYLADTAWEIIERNRTEETLRETLARFDGFAETAQYGMAIADMDGNIVYVNSALMRLLGEKGPEACLGKKFMESYYSPEMRSKLLDEVLPALRSEGHWRGELEILAVDGKTIPVEENYFVVRDDQGKPLYFADIVTDISDRRSAEMALRESESRYRDLFENAIEGIFQVTPVGRYISLNPAHALMHGYDSPEEMLGEITSIGEHVYANPDDRRRFLEILNTLGVVKEFETEIYRRDRKRIWVSINARAGYDDDGKILYYEGTSVDITDRKRATEALAVSEERHRAIFESVNDAIFLMEENRLVECNPKTLEMFRCEKEWIMGKTPFELSPELQPNGVDSKTEACHRIRTALQSKISFFEWKHRRRDGELFDAEVSLTPISIAGKIYLNAIVRDITDRKIHEEELFAEKDKFQTLSENAPFGMVLIEKGGRFAYMNNKFKEYFGYDQDDVPDGRTWFRKAYPDDEYRTTVISAWVRDSRDGGTGEKKPRIFTVTCKDGVRKTVNFVFLLLASGDYLLTCEDITELRKLESQLRQSQKMEAIGTLAGGVAHDFNNILMVLTGYGSLLQMGLEETNPMRHYVDQIISASQRATELTRKLLTFSRQQAISLAAVDINETIISAEKLLKRLLTEDIDFKVSLVSGSAIIMADASQIDQILFNLVANARDAMPRGGMLSIKTEFVDMDEDYVGFKKTDVTGRHVRITLSDTGSGMDEETREKIFEPFFTTKKADKGTGLGLSTVYGIVRQHNGHITVYSEPGQGTTFHLYFPTVKAEIYREERPSLSAHGGKEVILVAEDNDAVRELVVEVLRQHGYTTIEAVDGEDAIEKYIQNQSSIDLILLDSVMPKRNGREVYEEVEKIAPGIKVLFTSGHTKDIVLDRGIADAEFDFLPKPISPIKLLQKIREMLDRDIE